MENQKRLSLDELMKDRVENGLSNYLEGGIGCTGTAPIGGNDCGDCLPCENYCHDAE